MKPTFVVAGRLSREYILPPLGTPLLDAAGGSALYAAGGVMVWEGEVGLLARVGEDYPRPWLREVERRGLDIGGIKILEQGLDLRSFIAYNENFEVMYGNPVTQFAHRQLTFPKALLGYQSPPEGAAPSESRGQKEVRTPELPAVEIPPEYREARAAHLCPLDFASHNQLIAAFRSSSVTTVTLDPSPAYMLPAFLKDLRAVLAGVTVFLPSEEELRGLFWGQTHDLWEMAAAIGEHGCEVVVVKRGGHGQAVYDSASKRKWELPAYPARRADPTGAGDAFCGGYLAGFKKTYDPLQAALYGNISASLKVEGSGAFYPLDVLPGLAEARLSTLKDLVREV